MLPDRSSDPRRTVPRTPAPDASPPETADLSRERTKPRPPGAPVLPPARPHVPGFAITAEIARGGMGCVFAGRDLTLDREVAVKTLLPGADPARFVTEAKITARLPHPGIPPVHALGTLPDGGHYLAMKLIRGQTLSKLLRERPAPDADLPRFVQVFEQIAQAVGFAHSRGVLHRDLKPANVMVGEFGEVQVVDWGLAKEARTAEPDVPSAAPAPASPDHTQAGQIMGTPAYMAPEQARGESVDARADVFALGGILAVILTDNPPFVGNTVMDTVLKAAQGELDECFEELDECEADGELVGIAKRALAPHPDDRYADGRELAAAVAAYRVGVEERLRDAETERAKARVREAEQRKRRRVVQWAGGVTLGVLLLGVVGTSVGMVRANAAADKERAANETAQNEKTKAVQAAEAEKVAKVQAVDAAAKAKTAKEQAEASQARAEKRLAQVEESAEQFLALLQNLDPQAEEKGGKPLFEQLRERAEQAADKLDADAVGDPRAVARLQAVYGSTLSRLGNAAKAIVLLEKARATFERELGPDHSDTLNVLNRLAAAYYVAGRLADAVSLSEWVRDGRTKNLGPDHPDTLVTLSDLAETYRAAGRLGEAVVLYEQIRDGVVKKVGADHPNALSTLNSLAAAYCDAGRVKDAIALYEQVRDIRIKKFGSDHIDTLTVLNNLASAYSAAGRSTEAVALYERVRDALIKKLGADHPFTLATLASLASAYSGIGRVTEAVVLLEQASDALVKKLGADHPNALTALGNLALAYQKIGRITEAITLNEQVRDASVKKLGADHPHTLTALNNLAAAYLDAGRVTEAVALYEWALDARIKKLGADHPNTLNILGDLGRAYCKAGQGEKATAAFKAFIAGLRKHFPPDDLMFVSLITLTGRDLLNVGQHATAEEMLRECLAAYEKRGPDVWITCTIRSMLGAALLGQKKYTDAEPLLLKGYEGMKTSETKIPPNTLPGIPEALDRLVEFYTATDKPDEAAKWRAERAKHPFVAPPPRAVKR